MRENSAEEICNRIINHSGTTHKNVLEIGCGSGRISLLLSHYFPGLIAIDPDEEAIEQARRNGPAVDFRPGSGEKLDFPDSSFDLVIFSLSLHHQASRKALSEASRVLKKDGRIIVVEPVVDGELEQVFAFIHNENDEKKEAQYAITHSGLALTGSEVFTADWIFDNEEDCILSIFGYYNVPVDSVSKAEISEFLGQKLHDQPIILKDKMVIQVLAKSH